VFAIVSLQAAEYTGPLYEDGTTNCSHEVSGGQSCLDECRSISFLFHIALLVLLAYLLPYLLPQAFECLKMVVSQDMMRSRLCPFHVCITQIDLLEMKLKYVPFNSVHLDYDGDNSRDSVLEYLIAKVRSTIGGRRKVHVHVMNCLDRSSTKSAISRIEEDLTVTFRKPKQREKHGGGKGATALRPSSLPTRPSRPVQASSSCCNLM